MAGGKNANKKQKSSSQKKSQSEKQSEKQQKSSSGSSVLPWLFGIFLVIGSISAIIVYDTNQHGGVFEKSATGKFLKDTGALPYVEIAWTKSLSNGARGYQWAEHNVPIYLNRTCTALRPYSAFGKDLAIVILNGACTGWERTKEYAAEKGPLVKKFFNQYIPGVPDTICDGVVTLWNSVRSASIWAYKNGIEFCQTKIFVGSLSPDNLGKALNSTQKAVADYYLWFHKKVDHYAKIQ